MGYKERVQNELKGKKLKGLWQEICESYEQGGLEQVKSMLDSSTFQIKRDYKELLQTLEDKL